MKLRNKLFAFTSIFVTIAALFSAALIVNSMYISYRDAITHELLGELRLIDNSSLDPRDIDFGSMRFTEISPDGTVLFDSEADAETMENHLERKEVQDALLHMQGFDIRESETVLRSMFYVAMLSKDGNVIRLSESQSSIYSFILSSVPFIVIILIVIIAIVLIISRSISKRIVDPINEIDLDDPIDDDSIY